MKKIIFLLIIILAVIFFMLNFSSEELSDKSALNADKQNQALVVVTPWEITSVDPSKSGYIFQRLQLAETLVDVDKDGHLLAGLAESWTVNPTSDQWVFTLRPNVKFHDGSILTAEDVVNSLTIALTKPTPLKNAMIKEIKALDEQHVQFTLDKPLVIFPAYLSHATTMIFAKSAVKNGEISEVIGTGPYRVLKIEPPQKIEQTAFDDYWGDKAKIKQVSYLANSRSETRSLLAQSKPNYLVFNLDPASLSRLSSDNNLTIQVKPVARTIQYKVNVKNPLFADVAVRQALSDAIDREGIVKSVLRMESGEAEQILPPAFADWHLNVPHTKPDYPAIKSRLINLGFEQDANGMLVKDGKPFQFTLRTFSDRPELPIIATALQNQWKQIGVDMIVSVGNFSEIPAGHQDGSLEMALYSRYYGMLPDPTAMLLQDFAPQGADWGVMNWSDNVFTETLEALQKTSDEAEQRKLKAKAAEIIYQQKPITAVSFYQTNAVSNKALKGLELDPFERNFKLNKLSW
ncbi:ABC transporter substrate-binding protein [Pasteurella bettyae]|uniref:ABC transporter substrate-binding protein n=1 Tax=Pasteurella bettyae TaxID=752 RepID=UPI003D269B92